MAVTSDAKGCTKRKRTSGSTKRRRQAPKRRDPFAAALADARYRKQVVKPAKRYSRKRKPETGEDESE